MKKHKMGQDEKNFLREFKLIMMDGIKVRKRINAYYSKFRIFKLDFYRKEIYWNSAKRNPQYISFDRILKISKKPEDYPFEISTESINKHFVIEYKVLDWLDETKKKMFIECMNEYSRDVIYDGFCLLIREYRNQLNEKEKERKKKPYEVKK